MNIIKSFSEFFILWNSMENDFCMSHLKTNR